MKSVLSLATLLTLVLILPPGAALADVDALVQRFLLLGDIVGWPNHLGDDEPAIEVTLVPCRAWGQELSDEYLHRWSRIYFPRTTQDLMQHDVLFFNHPRLSFFTYLQQRMMVEFISTKDRVPIAYPLSHYADVQEPWLGSPVCKAFPIDFERFVIACSQGLGQFDGLVRLRLESDRPPVFSAFEKSGMFSKPIYQQFRPAIAREGATIWVKGIDGPPRMPEAPAFLSWQYGETEAWGFGIHPGTPRTHWQEAGEWWELVFLNICYYTQGSETLHFDEGLSKMTVKSLFSSYRDASSIFHGIVDFVSRVGANTARAEEILLEGDAIRDEAMTAYLLREYSDSKSAMEHAIEIASRAMDDVTRAKNSALLWIHISEWLVTSSVATISGALLWWLMVRRRLYREIGATRLRSS